MGRAPCCSKVGLRRGPWTATEDALLINYIQAHSEGRWRNLPKKAGLLRCGKSCRLRWMNYLRPGIKRGNICPDEDDLIIRLHSLLGNRWSLIAGRLPGRTDNEIKNYWNSHLSKRLKNNKGTNLKCKRESRKRDRDKTKETKTKRKKDGDDDNASGGETKDTKIYLPKPIKVSPFLVKSENSFPIMVSKSSSSCHTGVGETALLNQTWCNSDPEVVNNDGEIPAYNAVHDFVYHNQASCLNSILTATNEIKLDQVFEEYQQLLIKEDNHEQIDSFVDSLLA